MPSEQRDLLRMSGLRVTAPRLAVLELLDQGSHLPADAIVAAVRERTGSVSTQGVYNVLTDLVTAGLVHRIEPAGSAALYERSRSERHHHLICRSCGAVNDVACDHDFDACVRLPDLDDYSDIETEILFWGTCPTCRTSWADSARTPSTTHQGASDD
jgi:Fe2+ or Zn2+ uptake regulation protein